MSESKTPTPTPEPMTDERTARWRTTADLDARAGQPVGVALREAADEVERLRTELAAFVPPGALSAGEIPALCGTCKELLCVPGLPGCARCVSAEIERLRVEQATVFAALRDALGTSPATLGQAAAHAIKALQDAKAERDEARRGKVEQMVGRLDDWAGDLASVVAERDRLAEQVKAFATVIHSAPQCGAPHDQTSDPYCDTCHICDTIRAALNETKAVPS